MGFSSVHLSFVSFEFFFLRLKKLAIYFVLERVHTDPYIVIQTHTIAAIQCIVVLLFFFLLAVAEFRFLLICLFDLSVSLFFLFSLSALINGLFVLCLISKFDFNFVWSAVTSFLNQNDKLWNEIAIAFLFKYYTMITRAKFYGFWCW